MVQKPPPAIKMQLLYLLFLLILLFILFDSVITIASFGFYSSHFSFNSSLIHDFLFNQSSYSFLTSPFDFVIILSIRSLILIVGFGMVLKKLFYKLGLLFFGFQIFNWAFTLTKLLAFSELPEQLTYPGIYFSLVWNIVAFILVWAIWYFGVNSDVIEKLVERRQEVRNGTDREQLISEETETENNNESAKKEEPIRLTTFAHVGKILYYCKAQWQWYMAGFTFLLIYAGARVFIPHYTGQVISTIISSHDLSELVSSVIFMSCLTLVSTIFGGLRGGCFDYATALMNQKMRRDLFRSIISQEIAFFDEIKTGEVVSRLTADCQTMSSMVSTNVNVFLRNSVMLIGSLVFMFSLSWRLTLVSFIAVPIVGFLSKVYGAYYEKLSEQTQNSIADANHVAEEVISSMRTVRSFACEKKECTRFEGFLARTLGINKKKSIAYMSYTWLNECADNAILVAVLFYGGHLVISGKMDVKYFVSFLLYQMQLGENLYNIGYVFSGLMESVGASRKVFEYMNRQPKIVNVGTLTNPVEGKVEFQDVSFAYPTRPNIDVLQNVSFEIKPGETVALVGPSGAGKSSIIQLIEHFYTTKGGKILLDQTPVEKYNHEYYHQRVALVAQEPVLYDGSVRYNILYGCDDTISEEDMLKVAKLANVHDFVMEMEKGYDTNCGEKGVQMSGGQKQRIAIARALVRNPNVLILDEATSALDAESEAKIQEALQKCSIGRTVIVIAHRLSTVEKADRIFVINKGRLLQVGNHQSLLQDTNGLYYSLVQRQMLAASDGNNSHDSS